MPGPPRSEAHGALAELKEFAGRLRVAMERQEEALATLERRPIMPVRHRSRSESLPHVAGNCR